MKRSQRWRPGAWLLLVSLAGAGSIAGLRALSTARRELPLAVGTRLSKALGRPVALGGVSLWPLGAFSLGNVRVPVLPGEECPPLVARRVRVNVSWWQLLVYQRLEVTGLHVDGARVCSVSDLRRPAAAQASATEKLLSLGRAGL